MPGFSLSDIKEAARAALEVTDRTLPLEPTAGEGARADRARMRHTCFELVLAHLLASPLAEA